jgi:peptide/nickel transport system permease protein
MAKLYEYIVRRFLSIIPQLLLITLIVFTIIHIAPGDPLTAVFGDEAGGIKEDKLLRELYIEKWGLNKPIWEQYLIWLSNVIRGDLGYSFIISRSVFEIIVERIPLTLELGGLSLLLSLSIGIPLGVISAVKQGSLIDRIITSISVVAYSTPSFWTGIVMIIYFSVNLGWFPTSGAGMGGNWVDHIQSLIMPTIVLGFGGLGLLTRLTRNSVLEVLREDYIITARAKGVRENLVIFKHALRNALLPVVTVLGLQLAFLLSGTVLVETVFAWPGMGRFFVLSAKRRDYTTLMGINLMVSVTIIFAMLLTDIAYALIDPRIKY